MVFIVGLFFGQVQKKTDEYLEEMSTISQTIISKTDLYRNRFL